MRHDALAGDRQLALEHFKQGCWDLARGYLNKILTKEPNNAGALYLHALCLENLGNQLGAFNDFGLMLSINPRHIYAATARKHRGDYLQAQENWARAADEYSAALASAPALDLYLGRGKCLVRLGRYSQALSDFNAVAHGCVHSPHPLLLEIWFWRGECYYFLRQWAAARVDFDKAIQINPSHGMALARRGECYLREKNLDRVILDLDEAVKILLAAVPVSDSPNLAQANAKLSYAYGVRGRYWLERLPLDQAMSDLKQSILLDPLNATALASMGECFFELKNWDEAIKYFSEALRLNPKGIKLKALRGQSHLAMKEYASALADFSDYLQVFPKVAQAVRSRAHAYVGLDKWEEALADYLRAAQLGLAPNQLAYYHYALCYVQLGQPETALAHIETCLNLSREMPLYAHARMVRGRAFFDLDKYNDAAADMAEAIRLLVEADEANLLAVYYDNHGQALTRAGRFEEAIVSLSEAIRRNPREGGTYYWRGHCLMHFRGQYEAALEDFNAAIAIDPEHAGFYTSRGHCYKCLGNLPKSIEDLTRALALDEHRAWAYWYRSETFMEQRDYWSALSDLNALLQLPPEKFESLERVVSRRKVEKRRQRCRKRLGREQ